jgi:hypothetical protein
MSPWSQFTVLDKFRDFGKDHADVEINHALGRSDGLDLTGVDNHCLGNFMLNQRSNSGLS